MILGHLGEGPAAKHAQVLLRSEARLPEGAGFRDVDIAGSRIRRIAPRIAEIDASEIVAGGRHVIPGLVESHFHMDKALLRTGAPHWAGTVQGAIRATAEAKRREDAEREPDRVREPDCGPPDGTPRDGRIAALRVAVHRRYTPGPDRLFTPSQLDELLAVLDRVRAALAA